LGEFAGGVLQAEIAHLARRGADEDDAGLFAHRGEIGVFAQEAVAGVNSLGASLVGGFDDIGAVEIALRGRGRTDADGLTGQRDMAAVGVGLGIDGDGADTEPVERADDPAGDLSPIGNQYFFEHGE
jgi:hypothetical protein